LYRRFVGQRSGARWTVFFGAVGVANFAAFLWMAENTEPPPLPVAVVHVVVVVVLLVAPWAYPAVRRLDGDVVAGHVMQRVMRAAVALGAGGLAVGVVIGAAGGGDDSRHCRSRCRRSSSPGSRPCWAWSSAHGSSCWRGP